MTSADATVDAAGSGDATPGGGAGATPWARVVAVGVVAGLASGLFGVGGGIIIVPALMAVAGFAPKLATGTSLTAIVPISISGAIGYTMAGEVDWFAAGMLALGALTGALAGTWFLVRIEPTTLQRLFAGALLATATRMLFETGEGSRDSASHAVLGAVALLLVGLASGVLAGLLGVGGGILIVPVLTLGFGLPLALAKGTSLVVIIPTAILGTWRNRASGLTALPAGTALGVAGMASAFLASQISVDLDGRVSSVLFAILLSAVAIRLYVTTRRAATSRPSPKP
jgi:uncharacterized protein